MLTLNFWVNSSATSFIIAYICSCGDSLTSFSDSWVLEAIWWFLRSISVDICWFRTLKIWATVVFLLSNSGILWERGTLWSSERTMPMNYIINILAFACCFLLAITLDTNYSSCVSNSLSRKSDTLLSMIWRSSACRSTMASRPVSHRIKLVRRGDLISSYQSSLDRVSKSLNTNYK